MLPSMLLLLWWPLPFPPAAPTAALVATVARIVAMARTMTNVRVVPFTVFSSFVECRPWEAHHDFLGTDHGAAGHRSVRAVGWVFRFPRSLGTAFSVQRCTSTPPVKGLRQALPTL